MEANSWYPFSEINTLRDQINKFTDESLIEYSKMADPSVNIYEEEDKINIKVSMPQSNLEDTEVLISEESILIQSRDRTNVIKSLSLPIKVKAQEADTEIEEGIIKIVVPKIDK
ncbi:Hsp20/alpha crystallin family protein [Orenia marismortui]|uniref:Hsp20/alpha crystallin family protein n=1 Tax=Orenia marismortui TaxID=46469 RepID=UPI00036689DF|nr:Hsp20/alpha crystallin family protein [Orenia marismortui]